MTSHNKFTILYYINLVKGTVGMGIYLNPGNERFARVLRSKIYVDKTGMLEYLNSALDTEQSCICVSRPRRFGKSITADMLAAYYGVGCDSREMFAKYKAAELSDFSEHLNKYQVIQIDVNTFRHRRDSVTGETITAMQTVGLFHTEVIRELRQQFPQSVGENDNDLPSVLAKINEDTGEKFVIIIDEWDTIFREDKYDEKAQEAYINLLRGLFKDSTSKNFLKLAYITGILPIKKYGTQSALNNFREYTMIMPGRLAEYIGFTEDVYCLDSQIEISEFYSLIYRMHEKPEMNYINDLHRRGILLEFLALAMSATKNMERTMQSMRYSPEVYVKRAAEFIRYNYATITVSDVVEYVGFSRSYFSTLFKQMMGVSLQDYLMKCRIDRSKELLERTELSIQDIAVQAGYDNPLNFSRAFKGVCGTSPVHYRQSWNKEKKKDE